MNRDPLLEAVIGLAIGVHRTPGPVSYKGRRLDVGFRADMVVRDELLIEIKSVEKQAPLHEAQVLTYLRLGGYSKGLLMNFNTRLLRDGLRRFVM